MKSILEQNYYELLEIDPETPQVQLAEALASARTLWADESGPTYSLLAASEREALIERIQEAEHTLLDPAERLRYHANLGLPAPSSPTISANKVPDAEPVQTAENSACEMPNPPMGRLLRLADSPVLRVKGATAAAAAVAQEPVERLPDEISPPVPEGLAQEVVPQPTATETERPDPADFFRTPLDARGANFRRFREACGIDLKDLARQTRISRMHLENIEADAYGSLPALVYVRGFLESYCKSLKLDAKTLVPGYLEHLTRFQRFREGT